MTSSTFLPYSTYYDSGNLHVGAIPEGWQRRVLGAVSDVIDPQPDHRAPAIVENGEGFPYIGIRDVNIDGSLNFETARPVGEIAVLKQELAFSIEAGDIIFCKVGTLGLPRIIRPHGRCALSATLVLIKKRKSIVNRYLLYALDSIVVQSQTNFLATGSTRAALGIQQIRKFQIPYPTLAEQDQIAKFLDYETAKIDALIDKQQQLIALLKEKRQAVISHAVTKGLNPKAPLRDSGVRWLGEIPAHWKVKRFKHISPKIGVGLVINPSTYTRDTGVYFLFGGDVIEHGFDLSNTRRMSKEDSDRLKPSRLNSGDIVIVRVGDPGIAAVVLPEMEGANCASVLVVRKGNFDSQWLCSAINAWIGRQQVGQVAYGAAQKQFNVSDAVNFVFPTPPRDEQKKIAMWIAEKLQRFEDLSRQAAEAVGLLQERRNALISAAVTGKIDVRNWNSPVSKPEAETETA